MDTIDRNYLVNYRINVIPATYGEVYGAGCGKAATQVRRACGVNEPCCYIVDVNVLGNPANGCGKTFSVEYLCIPDATPGRIEVSTDAGLGSVGHIICQ